MIHRLQIEATARDELHEPKLRAVVLRLAPAKAATPGRTTQITKALPDTQKV